MYTSITSSSSGEHQTSASFSPPNQFTAGSLAGSGPSSIREGRSDSYGFLPCVVPYKHSDFDPMDYTVSAKTELGASSAVVVASDLLDNRLLS